MILAAERWSAEHNINGDCWHLIYVHRLAPLTCTRFADLHNATKTTVEMIVAALNSGGQKPL